MRVVDDFVSTAVWMGAYRQALEEGRVGTEAVSWADDILTQVQPQASPIERAGVLRDKKWLGQITAFYGYLSVAYRAQRRLVDPFVTQAYEAAPKSEKAKVMATAAGSLLGFYVAYAALGDLLMGRGPEDGDADPEDPENEKVKWANWLKRKVFAAPLTATPTPLGGILEAAMLKKKPMVRTDPLSGFFYQGAETAVTAYQAVALDGSNEKAMMNALRFFGLLTGQPVRAFQTTGKYLFEVGFGDRDVPNVGRFVGGVLYGEKDKQPENLPQVIGDAVSGAPGN